MKRILSMILAAFLLLSGCGAEAAPETTQAPTVAAAILEVTVPETTAPTEPPVEYKHLRVLKTCLDAEGNMTSATEYFYDDQYRQTGYQTVSADGTTTDAQEYRYVDGVRERDLMSGVTVRETFDDQGNCILMERYLNGRFINSTESTYDDRGLLIQETGSGGSSTSYEYDDQGNRIRMVSQGDYGSSDIHYANTYDAQGRLARTEVTINGTLQRHLEYAYEGSRVTETTTYMVDTESIKKGETSVSISDYDEFGNLIRYEVHEVAAFADMIVPVTEYTYTAIEIPG